MWTGPSYSPGLQHSHHGCSFLYALKARKPKTNPKTHTLLSHSTTSTAVTPPPPNTHTHTHTHTHTLAHRHPAPPPTHFPRPPPPPPTHTLSQWDMKDRVKKGGGAGVQTMNGCAV